MRKNHLRQSSPWLQHRLTPFGIEAHVKIRLLVAVIAAAATLPAPEGRQRLRRSGPPKGSNSPGRRRGMSADPDASAP